MDKYRPFCLRGDAFPGGRERGGDFQGFFLYRMEERDVAGVEADAAVGVGAGGAVLEVALDGAAEGGELAADLMMTAGEELDLQKVIPVSVGDVLIAEAGFLRARDRFY